MPKKNFLLFIFAIATLITIMFFPISKSSAADNINVIIKLKPNFTLENNEKVSLQFYRIDETKKKYDMGSIYTSSSEQREYNLSMDSNTLYIISMEDNPKYTLDGKSTIEFTTNNKNLSFEFNIEKVSDPTTTPTPSAPAGTTEENTTGTDPAGTTGTSKFSSTMKPIKITSYGPATWSALGKNIMDFMGWIAGTIFVGVLLIGAIIYITAGSNEQGAETGKKAIFAAIIGIVVTALAWSIVTFVAGVIK